MRTSVLIPKIAATAGALVLGTLLLSGCSADSPDSADQTTSSDEGAPATGSTPTGAFKDQLAAMDSFENQKADYEKKLDACLAAHGATATSSQSDRDAANSACIDEVGEEPQPSAEQAAATRIVNQVVLDCVRGKGHKLPDLDPSGKFSQDMDDYIAKDATIDKDGKACSEELLN